MVGELAAQTQTALLPPSYATTVCLFINSSSLFAVDTAFRSNAGYDGRR
jgi:hypothetical protein